MPRQTDGKSCAFSSTSAFRVHHPPMTLYQVPDNGQTKSKTAMRACRRDVGLPEALEYVRQEVLTDPLAGVGHDNLDARINPLRADLHPAALGSELDRVGEQGPDHLLQPFRIARHCPRQRVQVTLKADVFRFCSRPDYIDRGVDDLRRLDLVPIHPQFAGDDARYIEEITRAAAVHTDGRKRWSENEGGRPPAAPWSSATTNASAAHPPTRGWTAWEFHAFSRHFQYSTRDVCWHSDNYAANYLCDFPFVGADSYRQNRS